jgi:hypothetical protein
MQSKRQMRVRFLVAAAAAAVAPACGDRPLVGGVDASPQAAPCEQGEAWCKGRCVETASDPANCGGCGAACGAFEVCFRGVCKIECAEGETKCGGGDLGAEYCADLLTDPANCGRCTASCGGAGYCVHGVCRAQCTDGMTDCGRDTGPGICVDLSSDSRHCGAYGAACAAGEVCTEGRCGPSCPSGFARCSGECVDLQTSATHCGNCGTACGHGLLCIAGACEHCGAELTNCGGSCVNLLTDPDNCGACGVVCHAGSGTACTLGSCMCAECDVAPESVLRVGFIGGGYRITTLDLGPLITAGAYTLYTPMTDPLDGQFRTLELRRNGEAVASTQYWWGATVTESSGVSITIEGFVTIEVMRALYGSMNLYGLPDLFAGTTALRVACECN